MNTSNRKSPVRAHAIADPRKTGVIEAVRKGARNSKKKALALLI